MARAAYVDSLRRARTELQQLRKRRAELDARIAKVEQVEAALCAVTGSKSETPGRAADLSSITNVVRDVLKSAQAPVVPPEVRDRMLAMGFDSAPYSQFLASVHVVLKRLAKRQEVFEFSFGDCKKYWWVKKSMPGGALPENGMLAKYYNTHRAEDLQTSLSYEESRAKEVAKYRR